MENSSYFDCHFAVRFVAEQPVRDQAQFVSSPRTVGKTCQKEKQDGGSNIR